VGVLLMIVVGLVWRCIRPGYEPCHSLINLTQATPPQSDSTTHRLRRAAQQRDSAHWHGGACVRADFV